MILWFDWLVVEADWFIVVTCKKMNLTSRPESKSYISRYLATCFTCHSIRRLVSNENSFKKFNQILHRYPKIKVRLVHQPKVVNIVVGKVPPLWWAETNLCHLAEFDKVLLILFSWLWEDEKVSFILLRRGWESLIYFIKLMGKCHLFY